MSGSSKRLVTEDPDEYEEVFFAEPKDREGFVPKVIPKSSEQHEQYLPPFTFFSIMELLESAFMLNSLSDEDKMAIVDALEETRFQAEDVVIGQGAEGDCLYIVDSGELSCIQFIASHER